MLSDEIKKVPIDDKKLNAMKHHIIQYERKNINTSERTSQDMVKLVKRIIEKTVDLGGDRDVD